MLAPSFPGAIPPERIRTLDSLGVALRLSEWGDPAGRQKNRRVEVGIETYR